MGHIRLLNVPQEDVKNIILTTSVQTHQFLIFIIMELSSHVRVSCELHSTCGF